MHDHADRKLTQLDNASPGRVNGRPFGKFRDRDRLRATNPRGVVAAGWVGALSGPDSPALMPGHCAGRYYQTFFKATKHCYPRALVPR